MELKGSLSKERLEGREVIRLRHVEPATGYQVTLTFPVEAGTDLAVFKERLVRMVLSRGAGVSR